MSDDESERARERERHERGGFRRRSVDDASDDGVRREMGDDGTMGE